MKYTLEELIDINQLQELQNRLNEIYSFPSAVIDNKGKILTAAAWQDVCTKFHRANKESEEECIKSDQYIMSHLQEANPAVCYRCPHGLIDSATPIIIKGRHLGNFFTGQFFLEPPDLDFFRKQAKKYGYNEEEYLKAVKKVPVWTKEQLHSYLFFIKGLLEIITTIGLKKLEEVETNRIIKESEEKYRKLIEFLPDAIIVHRKGVIEYCNRAAFKLFKADKPEQIISSSLFDRIHPDYQHLVKNRIDMLISKNEEIPPAQIKFIRLDQTEVDVEVQGILLSNEKEPVIQTIARDITELKKAEKKYQESHELYKAAFMTSPDSININKLDGTFVDINEGFTTITGYTKDDIIGVSSLKINIWVNHEERDKLIKGLFESGVVENLETQYRLKDGSIRTGLMSARLIKINDEPHILSITRDITARKELETEVLNAKLKAEESSRLKTAFLQNMSHEIRTPLNAIVGFSNLLDKGDVNPEKRHNFISIIKNSANQLLSIVNDILAIASIETGQEQLNISEVCVNSVLLNTHAMFQNFSEKQNVSLYLNYDLNDDESVIETDITKLSQVLNNLVGNALKFTHQGSVEFGYKHKNEMLEFYVKDTGIGISKEFQEKIFERFGRADTATKNKYRGTGLGLAISKAYIELMGGKIWLNSEPGKGTEFYFTLPYKPIKNFKQDEHHDMDHEKNKNSKFTILVAEDEEYNFLFIEELLMEDNYNIILAKNGKEAVEICKTNQDINLVLMDIKMPEMDGLTAMKEIKTFRSNLPVIAQTAYALEQEIEQYKNQGFDEYITKPIDEVLLKTMIARILKT